MTNFIKNLFGRTKNPSEENDFSAFFQKSSGEKAKLIRQVLREANEDQRRLMREYAQK